MGKILWFKGLKVLLSCLHQNSTKILKYLASNAIKKKCFYFHRLWKMYPLLFFTSQYLKTTKETLKELECWKMHCCIPVRKRNGDGTFYRTKNHFSQKTNIKKHKINSRWMVNTLETHSLGEKYREKWATPVEEKWNRIKFFPLRHQATHDSSISVIRHCKIKLLDPVFFPSGLLFCFPFARMRNYFTYSKVEAILNTFWPTEIH